MKTFVVNVLATVGVAFVCGLTAGMDWLLSLMFFVSTVAGLVCCVGEYWLLKRYPEPAE